MVYRRSAWLTATLMSLFLFCNQRAAGQAPASAQTDNSMVKSAGCTSEGVEAGCMVLTGFKDKKLYSLHFPAGKKPALDTAIAFEGKTGIDTCMQGNPVDVSNWTPLEMRCTKPASVAAVNEKGNESMTKTNEKKKDEKATEGKCSDWKAWHDRQPGHPATLHVTGKCVFKKGGYSVKLRPAVPQGINPQIYILDRIVHVPTSPTTQVITEVRVHYTEQTSRVYTDVEIHPDGARVPVKEVQ